MHLCKRTCRRYSTSRLQYLIAMSRRTSAICSIFHKQTPHCGMGCFVYALGTYGQQKKPEGFL